MSSAPEPEWTEDEQSWMLALAEYRAGLCPACGRDRRECTDPKADDAYTVPPPTRCHATTALIIAQNAYTDRPQPGALLWHAERKR